MKKIFKVLALTVLSFFTIGATVLFVIFITPSKIEFDAEKLINTGDFSNFYDTHNDLIAVSGHGITQGDSKPFNEIVKGAFISSEDKNFYRHNGIDFKRILKAIYVNVKTLSFKQGASTISQQLIKNTHLSTEKTISRKITEIKLTRKLEKMYSKDEILTMYLNTIYFGENTYGIYAASQHYFDKQPNELDICEAATLAGIISAPSRLNPNTNIEACKIKRNAVLERMYKCGYITEDQLNEQINKPLTIYSPSRPVYESYINATVNELCEILKVSPYEIKNYNVYTYYESEAQQFISDLTVESDYQNILIDNSTMGIRAYHSTCGEIEREIASTIKPILVYAPAIEEDLINEYTVIDDSKTTFGDYSPKNYNDKYYGPISIKDALIKSLNVPAVKVANAVGTEKIKSYGKKMGLKIENEGLSVALGNTGNGITLKSLMGAYGVLANSGQYKKPHFIRKITDTNNQIVYEADNCGKAVFSPSTTDLITHMLCETKNNGTAKKLSYLPYDVALKTGTGGNSEGNIDCYCIGYTSENLFGVWLGNKDCSLMDVSVTGSNLPTQILGQTMESTYSNNYPNNFKFENLEQVVLDKYLYDEYGEIALAGSNTPKQYTLTAYFKKGKAPTNVSKSFAEANAHNVNISIKDNIVTISYDVSPTTFVEIFKCCEGNKVLVYSGTEQFTDILDHAGKYTYTLVPVCQGNAKIRGQEITLNTVQYVSEKKHEVPDNWWIDD